MTMKRNLLALAISGSLVAVPMAAMAESTGPQVYGLIDIGLETFSDSDGVAGGEIFAGSNSTAGNSDDRDFALQNGMTSRLGVRGSEKLDFAGLTASYNLELQMDVLRSGGDRLNTRLGWAALSGDWGMVKVGTQWQALFEFGAWNTMRNETHGYGTYFYVTELLSDSLQFGFRQGSAVSYSYGSAWGHSESLAVNVTLGIGEGEVDGEQNENGLTSIQVGAQYSLNQRLSFNGVYVKEFKSFKNDSINDDEAELINIGARYSVTDALELGVNYMQLNTNNAAGDTRDAFTIASFLDFGNGLTGHLGVGIGSDDRDEDVVFEGRDIALNIYGNVTKALSDRTNVRIEFENVKYDGGSNVTKQGAAGTFDIDGSSANVIMLALQHNF